MCRGLDASSDSDVSCTGETEFVLALIFARALAKISATLSAFGIVSIKLELLLIVARHEEVEPIPVLSML